ncbi:Zinc finger FYVE/PHD-type [Trinorchestia longiramus]|nr:Zinc finger FYVE/PHD-type [Trinorchestia longiramus]
MHFLRKDPPGVCYKCVQEQLSGAEKVLLCKICSETREMWKRTGAWFYRGLPQALLPPGAEDGNMTHVGTQSLGGSNISIALLGRHSKAPPRRAHSLLNTDLTNLLRFGDKDSDSETGARHRQHCAGSPSLSSSLSPAASTSSVASLVPSHCSPRHGPFPHQPQVENPGFNDIFGSNLPPEEEPVSLPPSASDGSQPHKGVVFRENGSIGGNSHTFVSDCNGSDEFDYQSDSSGEGPDSLALSSRENDADSAIFRNDLKKSAHHPDVDQTHNRLRGSENNHQDEELPFNSSHRHIVTAKNSKDSRDSCESPVFTSLEEETTSSVSVDWGGDRGREPQHRRGSFSSSVCSSGSNSSTLPLARPNSTSGSGATAAQYNAAAAAVTAGNSVSAASKSKKSSDLGSVEFTLFYDSHHQSLHCTVHHAIKLKSRSTTGSADPYVKLHLLPGASKSNKLRTRTLPKTLNPEFNETLTYHGISSEDINTKTLRLLVMDEGRIHRHFLGEARVALKRVKAHESRRLSVQLSERINASDDKATNGQELGKLLLSLRYTSARGALIVGVVRCAHLRARDKSGYSDPYVKVQLKPDPLKRKMKTPVKWRNLNPEFNAEYTFEVRRNELPKRQLDVRVYDKDVGRSDDFIGGLVLGHDSRGPELRHWYDVLQYPDRRHDRWHNLRPMHSS